MTTQRPVVRAELEQVVREYRHVLTEYRRTRRGSRLRRHLGGELQRLGARFDALLAGAPLDEQDRLVWRRRLTDATPPPETPVDQAGRLVFRGRSNGRAELRLYAREDGRLDAVVDGAAVSALPADRGLLNTAPRLVYELGGVAYHEVFAAPPAVLTRLRDELASGRTPDPALTRELLEDGLVDRTLGLTARGRRALALDVRPARAVPALPPRAISVRGGVPRSARADLDRLLARVARTSPRPVTAARATLVREPRPAGGRPYVGTASLDLGGPVVRASASAATIDETIALLDERLRRNLRDLHRPRHTAPHA